MVGQLPPAGVRSRALVRYPWPRSRAPAANSRPVALQPGATPARGRSAPRGTCSRSRAQIRAHPGPGAPRAAQLPAVDGPLPLPCSPAAGELRPPAASSRWCCRRPRAQKSRRRAATLAACSRSTRWRGHQNQVAVFAGRGGRSAPEVAPDRAVLNCDGRCISVHHLGRLPPAGLLDSRGRHAAAHQLGGETAASGVSRDPVETRDGGECLQAAVDLPRTERNHAVGGLGGRPGRV